MTLDLALLALVALFGLMGLASGAIKQITRWAGLILGGLAARPLAARLTPLAAPRLSLPPVAANALLSAVLFLLLYMLLSWTVHRLLRTAFGERENGRGDKAFGFLLGAGKGAVLLYALLSLLIFFEKPLTAALGAPPAAAGGSAAVALARRHDLFNAVPVPALAQIQKLIEAAKNPAALSAFAGQPDLQGLLADPQLKAMLQNDALATALKSGDLSALKNDPRFQALLKDPRLAGAAGLDLETPR